VRLRYAYFIKCASVVKDKNTGEVTELRCTYDPATRGGDSPDGRKVKTTLHWVSARHAATAEARLYDHLFARPDPEEGDDFKKNLNPRSLEVIKACKIEPTIKDARPLDRFQFERLGYFCVDSKASLPQNPVFNRIVTLRDPWTKILRGRSPRGHPTGP
jgi:glutaminyl-tRNA synthetase